MVGTVRPIAVDVGTGALTFPDGTDAGDVAPIAVNVVTGELTFPGVS